MSLVQAVITEKFILAASDTRGIKPDNTKVDSYNKLIKLNEQIIFGCTGGVWDNYILFHDFCNYSEAVGLIKPTENINISYLDFVKIIKSRFMKMKDTHDNVNNEIKYSIMSIICGYNTHEFEATIFSLTPEQNISNGIYTVKRSSTFPYKCITAGKIIHNDEFEKIANRYHTTGLYDFSTIRQYKNILIEVFNNGIKIDPDINNHIIFERIRLKDVINE